MYFVSGDLMSLVVFVVGSHARVYIVGVLDSNSLGLGLLSTSKSVFWVDLGFVASGFGLKVSIKEEMEMIIKDFSQWRKTPCKPFDSQMQVPQAAEGAPAGLERLQPGRPRLLQPRLLLRPWRRLPHRL